MNKPQATTILSDLKYPKNKHDFQEAISVAYVRGYEKASKLCELNAIEKSKIDKQEAIIKVLNGAGQAFDAIAHAVMYVTK